MPEFYDYLEDTIQAEEELALVEAVLEDWTSKGMVDIVFDHDRNNTQQGAQYDYTVCR